MTGSFVQVLVHLFGLGPRRLTSEPPRAEVATAVRPTLGRVNERRESPGRVEWVLDGKPGAGWETDLTDTDLQLA